MCRPLLAGVLAVALALIGAGAAAAPVLAGGRQFASEADYVAYLAELHAQLAAREGEEWARLADRIPAEAVVQTRFGPTRVDHSLLREQVRSAANAAERAEVQAVLERRIAAARAVAAAERIPVRDARDRLARLQAERQAQRRRQDLRNLLGEWLARWFGRFTGSALAERGWPLWAKVLAVLSVPLLLAFLGYLWRQFRRLRSGDTLDLRPGRPAGRGSEPGPEQLWQQAAQQARAGDHRTALRLLYLAVLRHLDRQGLIRYRPSATNGSYLRYLAAGRPDLRGPLQDLTRLFESRWYGYTPAREADWAAAAALAAQIWRAAGGGAPPAQEVTARDPAI